MDYENVRVKDLNVYEFEQLMLSILSKSKRTNTHLLHDEDELEVYVKDNFEPHPYGTSSELVLNHIEKAFPGQFNKRVIGRVIKKCGFTARAKRHVGKVIYMYMLNIKGADKAPERPNNDSPAEPSKLGEPIIHADIDAFLKELDEEDLFGDQERVPTTPGGPDGN